ncbi:unnamed protein product [Sphenostylis stenocarpa]|uniref:Uncharacterized protein n=1 Tax=Sphenostylis stenocarpa TaxID=92480 RepID=A0AA86VB92_9FABA|nr:unnamed protein product [Sphenostylis stenocarpa]
MKSNRCLFGGSPVCSDTAYSWPRTLVSTSHAPASLSGHFAGILNSLSQSEIIPNE